MNTILRPVPGAIKPTKEDIKNLYNKAPFTLNENYLKLLSSLSTSFFEDLKIEITLLDGTRSFLYLIYGANSLKGILGISPEIIKNDIIVFGRDNFGRDILVEKTGKLKIYHSRKKVFVDVQETFDHLLKKLSELLELENNKTKSEQI